MRVLLACVEDARDVRAWSGTPFHMHQALLAAGVEVIPACPLRERFGWPLKAVQLARNAVDRTSRYSRLREPLLLDGYAAQIRRAVARVHPDVVLAPSTLPVARLDTGPPVVTWTDSTFAGMLDFYPAYANLSRRYRRLGEEMERQALARVALAVYTSRWAARTATECYGLAPERVAVLPFGANLPDPGVAGFTADPDHPCRLLLVGRGWSRKGVDLAIDTACELRSRGVPAVLDVVGSAAPGSVDVPAFVTVHGALEKDDPGAAQRLRLLFAQAAFFLLPTRADCTPVVLAEAQAYGVPVITSDVGGTASMVRHGRSGYALESASFTAQAVAHIAGAWRDASRYAALRREARLFYEERLNWPAAVGSLLEVIRDRVLGGADGRARNAPIDDRKRCAGTT